MTFDSDFRLDMVHRRKLSDLAYRDDASEAEVLRRLIDRAYQADLEAYLATAEKPLFPPAPEG